MLKRSLKRRLLRAQITLKSTLQEILELNKKRKLQEVAPDEEHMEEELRVLNKIAHQQALLIRYYENNLRDSA